VNSPVSYKIFPLGDHALTITLSEVIDLSINQKIIALFHHLQQQHFYFIKDIIPAYSSLTIVYDVIAIRKNKTSAFQFAKEEIEKAIAQCNFKEVLLYRKMDIPVCYDVSFGIDLNEMAAQKNISIEEIIQIHSSKTYRVFMIGFLPGFAYMGSVNEKIITPRKQQPRTKVLAGSIGIAGEQTGIYPFDSPGGWNIIGQTPLNLFDLKKENPVLLEPGDEIKFIPINIKEYKKIKENN
jgi:inhibitor of KinA